MSEPTTPASPAPAGFGPRLAARCLLASIAFYQRYFSAALPVFFGPACGCRFTPTCSHYAASAVRTHGSLKGTWLAVRRLMKCTPLHPGGFDPVPPRNSATPVCRRISSPRRRDSVPTAA